MERMTQARRYLSRGALFLAYLLFAPAAGNCTPTSEPQAVVVQLSNFQVKDDLAKAWVTLSVVDAFDLLTTGNFQDPTISDWQVTTDSSGQAQLCPDDQINISTQTCADVACRIYVFEDTVFGAYPCPKSMVGTTGCSLIGSQALADCHMTINTISASATGLGTWYSLIYLWDSQMTIVIAGEGDIEVTPIVKLEFEGDAPPLTQMEPLERALAARQLEILDRVPGRSEVVKIEEDGPQFLYTAPDAKLEELDLDPTLPNRVWHSTDQLPVLVQQLRIIEPRLELWLERIQERATLDDINLGLAESIAPSEQLFVITVGEAWLDPMLQDSILYAVDWTALSREISFEDPLQVAVAFQESSGIMRLISSDARKVGHDPERSSGLLVEAGYPDGIQMVLLVPEDDEALIKSTAFIAAQMEAINVDLSIEFVPQDEIQNIGIAMAAAGARVITLALR